MEMNKMRIFDIIETAINLAGVYIGVQNLESVLSIVILVINLGCLIARGLIRFINWVKRSKADGKITTEELNELDSKIKEGTEKLNELTNKTTKGDK